MENLPINKTDSILEAIDSERKELKTRQQEINVVINQIKSKVLVSDSNNTEQKYTKFGSKPQSVSERMELIKAFVELQKLSVDINKTVITTYEREFKMSVDLSKYLDTKTPDDGMTQKLSPSDVIKLAKKTRKKDTDE